MLTLLFVLVPLLAQAAPSIDLDVRLDPASRRLEVRAQIMANHDLAGFRLAREFEIVALELNGRPAVTGRPAGADFLRLPPGTRRITLAYHATLAAPSATDHRQTLTANQATASPAGSFLPAGASWYPWPGEPFSFRVTLTLPAGHKGLVEGDLVNETEDATGYHATYDFPHPAEGIDLMAGPYQVAERRLVLPEGRTIRLRTWFHDELAPLAAGYLDAAAGYLERYSRLIGAYPFGMFSVVSSPTPTGFGMPGLTYLGRDVLKLPFIRSTSLGHEVLHNWWGNGVYPDWGSGNWSEGLTTFLADYAYKEDEGEDAAREMRMGWLRDYAAVPPGEDFALKDFTARHHGIASIIGYDKAAMVFLMLRDRIGRVAFERGLRLLWQRKRFQTASWGDLEAAFSDASGQSQKDFFRQWVMQPGAPSFTGSDPDFRIWRRIDSAVFPPILREIFVAPRASLIVTDDSDALRQAALALAARLLDAQPTLAATLPREGAALIVGTGAAVDAWLADNGLPPRPPEAIASRGSAQVWAGRDRHGRAYAVITARDGTALRQLERALPHYGKQSWLIFDGARLQQKGIWPPRRAGAGP